MIILLHNVPKSCGIEEEGSWKERSNNGRKEKQWDSFHWGLAQKTAHILVELYELKLPHSEESRNIHKSKASY